LSRQITFAVLALLVLGGLFVTLRPNGSNAGPQDVRFNVSINGDAMEPNEFTVRDGDTVTFQIKADRELDLHFHGYDEEVAVKDSETATLSFEANKTGSWPIEEHETEAELGKLVVQPREGN